MSAAPERDTRAASPVRLRGDVFDELTAERGATSDPERAQLVGISKATLFRWRNRRFTPSLEQAMAVAAVLGTTVDELFERAA
jgi:DNA-binding XRE family transcriptional regulator